MRCKLFSHFVRKVNKAYVNINQETKTQEKLLMINQKFK